MKGLLVSLIILLCLTSVFSLKSLEIEDEAQTALAERNHNYPIHHHERTNNYYSVRHHDSWRDYDSWKHKGRGEYAYGSRQGKRSYLVQSRTRTGQWWRILFRLGLPVALFVVYRIVQARNQYLQLMGQGWVQQFNGQLSDEHLQLAALSQLAYGNHIVNDQVRQDLQAIGDRFNPTRRGVLTALAGYNWHAGNQYWFSVRDAEHGRLFIVFRGTVFPQLNDLVNDVQIALGGVPNRVQTAIQYAQQRMALNQGDQTIITGHSLGGTVAEAVASYLGGGVRAVSFNPGSTPLRTYQQPNANIVAYHIRGDPISQWSTRGSKRVVAAQGGMGAFYYHTIDRFLNPL